jgi:hypothetical protein
MAKELSTSLFAGHEGLRQLEANADTKRPAVVEAQRSMWNRIGPEDRRYRRLLN